MARHINTFKIISRVIQPNSGSLTVNGEISTLLELGSGMNPDFDGIQNIYFGGIMMAFHTKDESKNPRYHRFLLISGILSTSRSKPIPRE
jgi:ABC-type polysaccharide/polyol phosphate transport system ATPase subunit